jgi:hypothetical protein
MQMMNTVVLEPTSKTQRKPARWSDQGTCGSEQATQSQEAADEPSRVQGCEPSGRLQGGDDERATVFTVDLMTGWCKP